MALVALIKAPDLSERGMYDAFVGALDAALERHRQATSPRHFTRAAFGHYFSAYRDLKKLLPDPVHVRRLRWLVARYGAQADQPLVLTGNVRNEILKGAVKFTSRGDERRMTWPNAPRYLYMYSKGRRAERGGKFNKAAAVVAATPAEEQTLKTDVDAAMQKYLDTDTVIQQQEG
jgi:hypothetical protein